MCVNSLDVVRFFVKIVVNFVVYVVYADKCNKGVVVGGMGFLSEKKLYDCFIEVEVIEYGYVFRSFFKLFYCLGNDGMLYWKGEYFFIKYNGIEMVC